MGDITIPFNRPYSIGSEFTYIREAIDNMHLSGDGVFTKKCQSLLEENLGVSKSLLTTSCTHALELAALLLDIKPQDEVIVPAFTFVSTVNAFVLRGAKPIFIDIRPDTLNLDESKLEKLITPKTKAIIVVHYAGVGCEMDTIIKIANMHGIQVVEDNAHGLFAKYRNKYLGTFGSLATLSFHETKNFICGEGGALLINDPNYIERAEIIREKGTDRTKFFRGEIDKYTWVSLGSSYLISDILAAYLFAQLEAKDIIHEMRRKVWEYYFQGLHGWALANRVKLPTVPSYCEQSYHNFYLILPSLEFKISLMEHLKSLGIQSISHYHPLHLSKMGRVYGGKEGDCPITENICDCLIRLPFYNELNESEQSKIIRAVCNFTS